MQPNLSAHKLKVLPSKVTNVNVIAHFFKGGDNIAMEGAFWEA